MKNSFKFLALIIIFVFTGTSSAVAQNQVSDTLNTVILTCDERFDKIKLVAPKTTGNGTTQTNPLKDKNGNYVPVKVKGFRLQVLNTTDRTQAYNMKSQLYAAMDNQQAYVLAKLPYYIVQFGDFFNRKDAELARVYINKKLKVNCNIVNAELLALPPEAAKDKLVPIPTSGTGTTTKPKTTTKTTAKTPKRTTAIVKPK
jgi:hypothetical protein